MKVHPLLTKKKFEELKDEDIKGKIVVKFIAEELILGVSQESSLRTFFRVC